MPAKAAALLRWSATDRMFAGIQRWTRRQRRPRIHPQEITSRATYIVPSRMGLLFGAILLILFLGSINYGNNLGFVLTFLLAAQGLVCMWHTQRNLVGVRIQPPRGGSGFVGDALRLSYFLDNPTQRVRYTLRLSVAGGVSDWIDLDPGDSREAVVAYRPTRRGWVPESPVLIETRYPLGLFYAWSWVEFRPTQLAYPSPVGNAPLPWNTRPTGGHGPAQEGEDELAVIRDYRPGDPRRARAWKASARLDRPMTLQLQSPAAPELDLVLTETPGADLDQQLGQLSQWVLDAESQGALYALRLPDRHIPSATGPGHRDTCLSALALYGPAPGRS
jgi:uncharacterized protein (DUF58 family)